MSQVLKFKPKSTEDRRSILLENLMKATAELQDLTAEVQQMMRLLAELEAK